MALLLPVIVTVCRRAASAARCSSAAARTTCSRAAKPSAVSESPRCSRPGATTGPSAKVSAGPQRPSVPPSVHPSVCSERLSRNQGKLLRRPLEAPLFHSWSRHDNRSLLRRRDSCTLSPLINTALTQSRRGESSSLLAALYCVFFLFQRRV